ncbi:MAG: zinc metalloprotease HtpX, partial [Solirubrobacterales bacterium]|nr:zinc metalloprotease HtpX [Solirubrobacterales bacterium]
MAPSSTQRFGRDRGLQARMLLTMFLLGAVYVVLVGALFASGVHGVLILLIAGGLFAAQFFGSEALALRAMGVQEVSPQDAPELHAMVERLCVQADLPKPRLGVVQTEMPNAFAMGR